MKMWTYTREKKVVRNLACQYSIIRSNDLADILELTGNMDDIVGIWTNTRFIENPWCIL